MIHIIRNTCFIALVLLDTAAAAYVIWGSLT